MGLDHVDIFYSHRPDPSVPIAETMSALHTASVAQLEDNVGALAAPAFTDDELAAIDELAEHGAV